MLYRHAPFFFSPATGTHLQIDEKRFVQPFHPFQCLSGVITGQEEGKACLMFHTGMFYDLLFVHTAPGQAGTCPPGTHGHAVSKCVRSHLKPIPSNPLSYGRTSRAAAAPVRNIFPLQGRGENIPLPLSEGAAAICHTIDSKRSTECRAAGCFYSCTPSNSLELNKR